MSETMLCAQAEELFSAHQEGALSTTANRDLQAHLADCAGCRELFEAVGLVLDALRPTLEMEPARELAERVATASWHAGRLPSKAAVLPRAWRLPWRVQALAAGLALVVTGSILFGRAQGPRLQEQVTQRSVSAGVYLRERGERLVEDLRVLRVVVATAFEGRMDRVNDRVDDYRKLLERRRQNPPARKGSAADEEGARHTVHFRTPSGTGS